MSKSGILKVENMSLNAFRENKILAKIAVYTVGREFLRAVFWFDVLQK